VDAVVASCLLHLVLMRSPRCALIEIQMFGSWRMTGKLHLTGCLPVRVEFRQSQEVRHPEVSRCSANSPKGMGSSLQRA
jgi:hypothetical protein